MKTLLITLALITGLMSCKKETTSNCSPILNIEEREETRLQTVNGFTYPVTNHYYIVFTSTGNLEVKSIQGLEIGKIICR